jgi:hypothetical protein
VVVALAVRPPLVVLVEMVVGALAVKTHLEAPQQQILAVEAEAEVALTQTLVVMVLLALSSSVMLALSAELVERSHQAVATQSTLSPLLALLSLKRKRT